MIQELFGALIGAHRNRPLSVAVAVAALIAPGTLIVFLAKPTLFWRLGLSGTMAMSAVMSLPLVMIAFGIFHAPLSALQRYLSEREDQANAQSVLAAFAADDPLEWPCALAGSWLTTVTLYIVAGVAYVKPIRIGMTLLLVAAILGSVWLIASIATGILLPDAEERAEAAT